MTVSGLVPLAIWEGEAAGGEPEVEAALGDRAFSRERIAERTGSVSIESGERPSGRLWREGWGVDWEGEVAILSGLTFCCEEIFVLWQALSTAQYSNINDVLS